MASARKTTTLTRPRDSLVAADELRSSDQRIRMCESARGVVDIDVDLHLVIASTLVTVDVRVIFAVVGRGAVRGAITPPDATCQAEDGCHVRVSVAALTQTVSGADDICPAPDAPHPATFPAKQLP